MARKPLSTSQSEFTDAELDALREKAKLEVADQRKKAQARELLEQFKEEELARLEPTLEMTEVLIDVPGYTNYIMVDGRIMNQGEVVKVPSHTAAAIREIVQNSWRHERSNGGAHMKAYMPPTSAQVSALAGSSGHKLSRV